MLESAPLTPAEEAADIAWEQFAAEQSRMAALIRSAPTDPAGMRLQLQRVATAERRFKRLFLSIDEQAAPTRERDTGWLACEGVLLVTVLAGFVALLVPDLEADFWSIVIGCSVVLAIGAWAGSFLTRLCSHWRQP